MGGKKTELGGSLVKKKMEYMEKRENYVMWGSAEKPSINTQSKKKKKRNFYLSKNPFFVIICWIDYRGSKASACGVSSPQLCSRGVLFTLLKYTLL